MTICLVTDRRRSDPVAQACAAAAAGIDLVQVRERDLDGRSLAALVRAVLEAVRGSATRVVVNDRLDVALACAADGVHLRADSIQVADARRIAPVGFLIGRSVHATADAADLDGADYAIAGTVFPTSSKPGLSSHLGEEGLRRFVAVSRVPVLAIGGMSVDTSPVAARAGAAGIAAIELFSVPETIDNLARALRSRFDTTKRAP